MLAGNSNTNSMNENSDAVMQTMKHNILRRLTCDLGKLPAAATQRDWLDAALLVLRDTISAQWLADASVAASVKRVNYLSLEFLIGRILRDALQNTGLLQSMQSAFGELGLDLDLTAALEPDAALGNGGLGRLAACFMDSMSTLDIPAFGYGIRYRHGLFKQSISGGQQQEAPEDWLELGNAWELRRGDLNYTVCFGGHVEIRGEKRIWHPGENLRAIAYDVAIPGWKTKRINTLRIWHATAPVPFDLEKFNFGDHVGALSAEARGDVINRVLYPADSNPAGHELRLRQQYFFVSASVQDIIHRHLLLHPSVKTLHETAAMQLNDTHPAIAIAELMRILMDVYDVPFEEALGITQRTCSYTNHTLLPEALETWPVALFEHLLPRHLQIIFDLNARVIDDAHEKKLTDFGFLASISLIDESNGRKVRMGQLAFVGSHKINGVSALHSGLMAETVFKSLNTLYEGKIINKTNGVTPRRWVQLINPRLASLVEDVIGGGFRDDAELISAFDASATDRQVQSKFAVIKHENKVILSALIKDRVGVKVDPGAIFDVQIKRIHEYKRQQMAILETVALYLAMKSSPNGKWVPRVKIFAGKAAASYWEAKTTIRLINDVAHLVNADPQTRDFLKVVFVPNYNVSLAEVIVPAADISEQISTAGMEASGTGNMKLAMNGAITVGTYDGANVEISEKVGLDNIFIFGLSAKQVIEQRTSGYHPQDIIAKSSHLKSALDAIGGGLFSPGEPHRYADFVHRISHSDWFMVAADFASYSEALSRAEALWEKPDAWNKVAIHNTARTGWFSSDRTIKEYAREIWGVPA
jgi:glycogen phosphorylase